MNVNKILHSSCYLRSKLPEKYQIVHDQKCHILGIFLHLVGLTILSLNYTRAAPLRAPHPMRPARKFTK